jgi:hypothetical protein
MIPHRELLEDLTSIHMFLNGGGKLSWVCAGLRHSNFMLGVTVGHILNADGDYTRYIVDETEKCSTGCA